LYLSFLFGFLAGFLDLSSSFVIAPRAVGPKSSLQALPADDDHDLALMTAFTNRYAKVSNTYMCSEPSVTAVVIKGLADHKATLGAPLCPCRFYEDKEAEVKVGYWNCPCVPMRERHECHCMLFLTPDNAFAGESQEISLEDVKTHGNV